MSKSAAECNHRIADARNPIITSGYICVDCGALFAAADHEPRVSGASDCALQGGKCSCPTACQRNMDASTKPVVIQGTVP